MTFQKSITFSTSGHRDIHEITNQVSEAVFESGIKQGLRIFSTSAVPERLAQSNLNPD